MVENGYWDREPIEVLLLKIKLTKERKKR